MLKVGLVGVGGISGSHIPAWDAMEDTKLAALCDIRPERMEPYPDKYHYQDFDEMLEKEDLDILDICLPTCGFCGESDEKGNPGNLRKARFPEGGGCGPRLSDGP